MSEFKRFFEYYHFVEKNIEKGKTCFQNDEKSIIKKWKRN